MRFAEPGNLVWLWVLPLLLLLLPYGVRTRIAALEGLQRAGHAAWAEYRRAVRWFAPACLLVAAGLMALSVAQPQWGYEQVAAEAFGRDVFVAVDVSRSMLATDTPPNRLERAKLLAKELAGRLLRSQRYRLGVIAFAGSASLKCPLTTVGSFALDTIDRLEPDSIARSGTHLGAAIETAIEAADRDSGRFTDLVLISDGEDLLGGAMEAGRHAREAQIAVHAVCVGDPSRGSLIPLGIEQGEVRYLEYGGERVRTRPNERLMRRLAELTGGFFVLAGARPVKLDELLLAAFARKPDRRLELWLARNMRHRYQWLLAAAAVLLAVELLVSRLGTQRLARRLALTWAVVALLAGSACNWSASVSADASAAPRQPVRRAGAAHSAAAELFAEGARLFRSGRYREAERLYRQAAERTSEPAPALFNAALAAYARADYRAAHDLCGQARASSGAGWQLRLAATFGLANAAVQLGRRTAEPATHAALLRAAITAYRDVLDTALPVLDRAQSDRLGQPLRPIPPEAELRPQPKLLAAELVAAARHNILIAKRELSELAAKAAAGSQQRSQAAHSLQRPGEREGQQARAETHSGSGSLEGGQPRAEPTGREPMELTREQAAQLVQAAVQRIAQSKQLRSAGTLRRPVAAERDW